MYAPQMAAQSLRRLAARGAEVATELARVFHKMWPASFQKGSESALRHGQRNRSFIYLRAVGAFRVGKDFRISKAEVCDHHNYNYVRC